MPFLNIAVILVILLCAFLWSAKTRGRGLFSALLASVCTLVAGAIAFAVWEPTVYGFALGMGEDIAWCAGLLVPFAVSLFVLRLIVDQTVKSNLDFSDTVNFIGGALFGVVTGVITAGILVIGVSFLRFGPAAGGYALVKEDRGNIVQSSSLWVPADKLTIALYEKLSLTSLSTETPLAERLPAVNEQAAASRLAARADVDGKRYMSRTAIKREDFAVKGRYRVEGASKDLLADAENPKAQDVKYVDGSTPPSDGAIEGFVVSFTSGGAEKSGQFVISPGQVRLTYSVNDEVRAAYPVAVVAQAAANAGMKRFRVDDKELAFGSVGGQSSSIMAFEFFVPRGAQVLDLFVKNSRADLETGEAAKPPLVLASAKKRDEGIADASLLKSFGVAAGSKLTNIDTSESQVIAGARGTGIDVSPNLPENTQLNKGELSGLEMNADNEITGGEKTLDMSAVQKMRGLEQSLRVDRFAQTRDTGIVKITIANQGAQSVLGGAFLRAQDVLPPMIVDADGNSFECIGFVYKDSKVYQVRFTPGRPIRGLTEMPAISTSKGDQSLYLIFRPTKGARIKGFVLGNKQVGTFDPPAEVR